MEGRSKKTTVYVWDMNQDGPGHASIDVDGKYYSIRPGNIPSMGPTIVLPVPAAHPRSLEEDMEAEATKHDNFDSEKPTLPSDHSTRKPPDHTYHLEGLNAKAMQTKMDECTKGTYYQLLPMLNIIGPLNAILSFDMLKPVDVPALPDDPKPAAPAHTAHNCTTSVSKILEAGGLSIHQTKGAPWGITPNALAKQLEDKGLSEENPNKPTSRR